MATLKKPKLLLLDEHTAALDPKTAAKVLDTTEKIVQRDKLTTLMITHNMRDAIAHGNRLIMMYEGRIAVDVSGDCSARPAGQTRRTTSCCWDKAVSCSTGPHLGWGGLWPRKRFASGKTLAQAGFTSAEHVKRQGNPQRGGAKSPAPLWEAAA